MRLSCALTRALLVASLPASGGWAQESPSWCDLLPRSAHRELEPVEAADSWFEVYRVGDGVFAIAEPYQFQEVISYLIVGSQRAMLFDTGLGIGSIARVVAELSHLPVTVLNSHTHFDHVGGNVEFDRVLAMDIEYTRANASGFSHAVVAGEVAPRAFCRGVPPGFDPDLYHTRAYRPSEFITDGHTIDLGERELRVLHIPGHTPDAVALFDPATGSLFTGDSFYKGPIWLLAPETDLAAFESSVVRLADLVPRLRTLHPAHNEAVSSPEMLLRLREAIVSIRAGEAEGTPGVDGAITFEFEGFSILTSETALSGGPDDVPSGGSGLERATAR